MRLDRGESVRSRIVDAIDGGGDGREARRCEHRVRRGGPAPPQLAGAAWAVVGDHEQPRRCVHRRPVLWLRDRAPEHPGLPGRGDRVFRRHPGGRQVRNPCRRHRRHQSPTQEAMASERAASAKRASTFTESVIREMTRIANQYGAINLAQGFPDFPMPAPMKDAACAAIHGDINQYAVTWGASALRIAIAEKYRRWYGMEIDHDREVTVTCGATEAMASVFLALIDPGDEVIVPEPFYENYGPDAILAGAIPTFVPLERPHWTLDLDRLKKAFTKRTKAIILNTPHNPTGRVFTRDEMSAIADLCLKHDVWAI